MTNANFKVKWCPVCNQGWVKIVKDKESGRLFLCCDECESEWLSPDNINSYNGTQGSFGQIINPSLKEVINIHWDKYLKKE